MLGFNVLLYLVSLPVGKKFKIYMLSVKYIMLYVLWNPMEQLRVVGCLGCQHELLTRSRSVQWHVTVWLCWINTNFVIEDEHVLIIQFLREIRSYSDAINSYELYCPTSTFCLYFMYFVKGL